MNVLIGFERSGVIRRAFRARGFNAWSCDLKPAADGSRHHYGFDIFQALKSQQWDLIILHPPCTALSVSGNHKYAKGKPGYQQRLDAIHYVSHLWSYSETLCKHLCLENPQGVLHTHLSHLPKPQYIQPYQFGEDASKKTGLTLRGLPPLVPTKRVHGRVVIYSGKKFERWANQTDSGQNRLGPSDARSDIRAETYPGVAKAMAAQWGDFLTGKQER